MWITSNNALRAGTVTEDQWNLNNIGYWSTAFGYNTTASKNYTTALGYSTFAVNEGAVSMGEGTYAGGRYSTATGFFNGALGEASLATGKYNYAKGDCSAALGIYTSARAFASVAMGQYNDTVAGSSKYGWITADPVFCIGNGTDDNHLSNALLIYKNGNADLNGFVKIGNDSTSDNNKAPRIKTKKITGFNTPSSSSPNTFTFVPHGISNPDKILSVSVLVTNGPYQFLPHSTEQGYIYTVNTDAVNGTGAAIAVGVKSTVQSSEIMGKPIKVFITYEE